MINQENTALIAKQFMNTAGHDELEFIVATNDLSDIGATVLVDLLEQAGYPCAEFEDFCDHVGPVKDVLLSSLKVAINKAVHEAETQWDTCPDCAGSGCDNCDNRGEVCFCDTCIKEAAVTLDSAVREHLSTFDTEDLADDVAVEYGLNEDSVQSWGKEAIVDFIISKSSDEKKAILSGE